MDIISIKTELWKQFGAAMDMFENALRKCPESLWNDGKNYWYIAYHTLFYLDYYLAEKPDNFLPPEPYTLSEFDSEEVMPEKVYGKDELLSYLEHCRSKCWILLKDLTSEKADARWINEYKDYSMFEILLYNLRHLQHHTGQLNYLLARQDKHAPVWVSQTKIDL
jgi:hypothetical protein